MNPNSYAPQWSKRGFGKGCAASLDRFVRDADKNTLTVSGKETLMKIAPLTLISLLAIFCPLKHAYSEVQSASLTVFAVVGAECQMSAARNFVNFEVAIKSAISTLSVRCSGLAPYVAQLGFGAKDAPAAFRNMPGISRRAVFNAFPKKQREPRNEEMEVPIAGQAKGIYPYSDYRVSPFRGRLVADSDVIVITIIY